VGTYINILFIMNS